MKVAYFISQPLDLRNRMRFGCDFWRGKGNEVSVFDLTPFQHPEVEQEFINRKKKRNSQGIKLFYILNVQDCIKACATLVDQKPWLAIDFMGSETSSSFLRIFLKTVKITRIVFRATCLPEPHKKISFQKQKPSVRIWNPPFYKITVKTFFNQAARILAPPQAEFTSSGLYLAKKRKNFPTKIFPVHSFDYDLYLKEGSRRTERLFNNKYAVFLDEDMCFHPDFLYGEEKSPHIPENYYFMIKNLFHEIEKKYRIRVVVAEHPRAGYSRDQRLKYFGRRPVLRNKTPALIKRCCLVLCHCSTAINFAVLYKKPIILLTTHQLESARYGGIISRLAQELHACKIKINKNLTSFILPKKFLVNQNKYDRYIRNYICPTSDFDGKPLWEKVSESMRALKPIKAPYHTPL